MMGGKWAYESLSFGGYWAWDPVENASLVPWMIMVAGLHCLAIYNSTGNSLRASYFFIILANAFVLYSTFLTRTGILGDTSVHSFTEAGLAMNVLIGMFALAIPLPVFIMYLKNLNKIPALHKEESTTSREFWMFIGVLILFLAAMYIIAITSIPVFNKVFNKHIADPQDREFTYNRVLVLVAVIVGILTGISQYLKYRKTGIKQFSRQLSVPLIISFAITLLMAFLYPITFTKKGPGFLGAIYLAIFACLFSFIANLGYIRSVLKGNLKAAGSAFAHSGFALMICGMLISSGNRQVITDNRKTGLFFQFGKDPTGREDNDPLENLTLIKNVPTQMAQYTVKYTGDSAAAEKNRTFINLLVEKKDPGTGKILESFELKPDVYKMKDNNLSSNPDIKHYLFHDIFTYISALPAKNDEEDTSHFTSHEMNVHDTAYYSKGYFVLNGMIRNPDNERFHFKSTDTALAADVTVSTKAGTSYKAYPLVVINNMQGVYSDDTVFSQNLFLRLEGLSTQHRFKIAIRESEVPAAYVTVKAYVFPYINLVWTGLILMASGFIVSIIRRTRAKPVFGMIALILVLSGLFYMFLIASN
jgi:cytochrome c-type biogenesis protein CcmF